MFRFARSKKLSHQDRLSEFKQSCKKIWEKQAGALSLEQQDFQSEDENSASDDDFEDFRISKIRFLNLLLLPNQPLHLLEMEKKERRR